MYHLSICAMVSMGYLRKLRDLNPKLQTLVYEGGIKSNATNDVK